MAAVLAVLSAAGQDLTLPPTAADRAAVLAKGWAVSRDQLGKILAQAYEPASATQPGSAGSDAYQEWLWLWQWSELLARDENAEAAKFLGQHLFLSPDDQRSILTPPGYAADPSWPPAPADGVQGLMAEPAARDRALGKLLRADAVPPQHRPLADLVPSDVLAGWLNDEDFSRMFFANLSPENYAPGVLRALAQIQAAHPDKFQEYSALALAIALVYDRKMPAYWPHHQVAPAQVPIKDYSLADWFAFWVANNEAPGALLDLRRLKPEEIKFVVDAPLDESEYAWAQANVHFSRNDFAQAYSSITYDIKRNQAQQYDWPEGPYTLAAISKLGGICVDQAYFAMIAGKAHCLPTLFFTGQGSGGGHAWFGYLESGDHWQMDCGRYENQNYATGEALDPQTWLPLSDHELAFLTEQFHARPEYAASQADLVLAGLFEAQGNITQAGTALDSAIAECPLNNTAWDAKTAWLVRTGAPLEALQEHHEAAARAFSTQPDLKAQHLNALADLARQNGDTASARDLQNLIIAQNADSRADLGVSSLAKQLLALIDQGQYDTAFNKYQQEMNELGKSGGGNFFYQVVQPFVNALLVAGEQRRAQEALEMARTALNPADGTILWHQMEELDDTVLAAPKKPPKTVEDP
ncbi:MAG: hypothetical protein ABSH19_02240 [Opitutales bacterium]